MDIPDHDAIAVSLAEFSIRLMRRLGQQDARITLLEGQLKRLQLLHDRLAADVAWLEATS